MYKHIVSIDYVLILLILGFSPVYFWLVCWIHLQYYEWKEYRALLLANSVGDLTVKFGLTKDEYWTKTRGGFVKSHFGAQLAQMMAHKYAVKKTKYRWSKL